MARGTKARDAKDHKQQQRCSNSTLKSCHGVSEDAAMSE
jgi:hypothetical protein